MDILIKNLEPIAITAEHIRTRLKEMDIHSSHRPNPVVYVPAADVVHRLVNIDDFVTPLADKTYDGYRIGRIDDDIRGWHRYREVSRSNETAYGGHLWEAKVSPLPIILHGFEQSIKEAVFMAMDAAIYYKAGTVNCTYDPDFYCRLLKDSMTLRDKPRLFPGFVFPDQKTIADVVRDFISLPYKSELDYSGYDEIIESSDGFVLIQHGERGDISKKTFKTFDEAIICLLSPIIFGGSMPYSFNPMIPSGGRSPEEIDIVMRALKK